MGDPCNELAAGAAMPDDGHNFQPTRRSLISRLKKAGDDESWREFFECYGKLIYGAARKAGLKDCEAQDVVQETIMSITKNISRFEYAPNRGSFKSWLLRLTRWRIVDEFRKRDPAMVSRIKRWETDGDTATLDGIIDPNALDPAEIWDEQWENNIVELALERVKLRVTPRQYQLFDLTYVRGWPVTRAAATLKVNPARVYLARHRLGALLREELKTMRKRLVSPAAEVEKGRKKPSAP